MMTNKLHIPWNQVISWGLLIGLFYVLRHFFFVIFLTFIVSYSMRTLVVNIRDYFFPEKDSRILDIAITIVCFIALLTSLYGVGAYLAPRFAAQGEKLLTHIGEDDPGEELDLLMRDTLGSWMFSNKYGPRESEAYQQLLAEKNITIENPSQHFLDEFEQKQSALLLEEWKKGPLAAKIEEKLEEIAISTIAASGKAIREFIPKIIEFPFHLALVLLLSFFITLDVPRLTTGVQRLADSRLGHIYAEIAPNMVSFGKLIGRAFQAQAIIAVVNSVLTLGAISFLDIDNEIFLCAVVFICSFIPVVGVVISSAPIALMAILQPDGGILLAVWAIIAILIIHFIETSLLNPKIFGDMLHLDPILVLAILAISEHFFGIWGLLLGVPVMVYVIRVLILEEGIPGLIEPAN